jgi:hypothetical protein
VPFPSKFNPRTNTTLVGVVKLGVVKGGGNNLLFGVQLHIRHRS